MSRPLRFVPEEYTNWTDSCGRDIAVVEITTRTLLGMFLLKPTPQNRSLIVRVMAHVQQRLKFRIECHSLKKRPAPYSAPYSGEPLLGFTHLSVTFSDCLGQGAGKDLARRKP